MPEIEGLALARAGRFDEALAIYEEMHAQCVKKKQEYWQRMFEHHLESVRARQAITRPYPADHPNIATPPVPSLY